MAEPSSNSINDALAPPQPRDAAGVRPPLDLNAVARQVQHIQQKLAAERAAKAAAKAAPICAAVPVAARGR
ncbi:MAG: hypothetical protein WCA89_06170 [Terracidiphilus sp.]